MVTYDPPRNGRTSPAMIAEISPETGGAPDATAIPSEKGSEINETINPETMSCRQCFNPSTPLRGLTIAAVPPDSPVARPDPETEGSVAFIASSLYDKIDL